MPATDPNATVDTAMAQQQAMFDAQVRFSTFSAGIAMQSGVVKDQENAAKKVGENIETGSHRSQ